MGRIGFIGTGHIAAPMARALARDGHAVTVSERGREVSSALAAAGLGIVVADNQGVVDASDIVFLSLRPATWEQAVAGLNWRADQHIVSVMAGVPLARIAEQCAPVPDLSVTIPLGFVEHGGCPLPVAGNPEVLQSLFGAANAVLPLADEAQLNDHFAASAMISGVLAFMETGAGWLAGRTGDSEAAERYVAHLIAGFLRDMEKNAAGDMGRAKWALATPGTLNRQMVDGLAEARAFAALPDLLARISASMQGAE